MRSICLFICALILSACASTPKVAVTPIEITPITQMKSEPFDAEELLKTADLYFKNENYAKALTEYSRLTSFDQDNQLAWIGEGNSLLALGVYERAANVFWDKGFVWQDDIPQSDIELGKIISGIYTDRYGSKEKALNDGLLIAPDDGRLWNAKGQLHDQTGDWMEALSCYVTSLQTGKGKSGTINNMGMSLLLQGRYDEAQEKFEQALSLSPDTQIYDNNLRMSYILMGDLSEALSDIDDVRASDIVNDAGYVAQQRGQTNFAERLYSKSLEISPVFHEKAQANLDALKSAASTEAAGATRPAAARAPA